MMALFFYGIGPFTMQGHMSSLDHNRLGCHSSIDRKKLWVEHHMCTCMV
jgi:hypothetical protein